VVHDLFSEMRLIVLPAAGSVHWKAGSCPTLGKRRQSPQL